MIQIVPIAQIEPQAVEALLDRAFGTDRHQRTAYRVRAGVAALPGLSFAAVDGGGALLGSIQCWPVALLGDGGAVAPMIMVGPVAVQPERQQEGIGRMLMHHAIAAADASADPGADALMLIGDPEYYSRFFGFTPDATGGWRMPGPFEQRRLLARGTGVLNTPGLVAPRPALAGQPGD